MARSRTAQEPDPFDGWVWYRDGSAIVFVNFNQVACARLRNDKKLVLSLAGGQDVVLEPGTSALAVDYLVRRVKRGDPPQQPS